MTDFHPFYHHYIESKLVRVVRPIRFLLSQMDYTKPFSSDGKLKLEALRVNPLDMVLPLSFPGGNLQHSSPPKDWKEEGFKFLRERINELIFRIDGHLDQETRNEWIHHSISVRNLSLCYDVLRLQDVLYSRKEQELSMENTKNDDHGIRLTKKNDLLIFLATAKDEDLVERIISYIWYQSRLLHMTDEFFEFSRENPSMITTLSSSSSLPDPTPKRVLLNITEKDIDLIKKIIDQEGDLSEITRGDEHRVLVKEISFSNLCYVLRNTYGYKTKMFKKFLEKYHRKHFYLRKTEILLSKYKDEDHLSGGDSMSPPLSSGNSLRTILLVSPFEPATNFSRDAAIMQRLLVTGEDEVKTRISQEGGGKKNKAPNKLLPYRVFFKDLLGKLSEETGSTKHKGYLRQMKSNPNWKQVFTIASHVTLRPTGGYNRKIVNNINKMFSEKQKSIRKKLEEEGKGFGKVILINNQSELMSPTVFPTEIHVKEEEIRHAKVRISERQNSNNSEDQEDAEEDEQLSEDEEVIASSSEDGENTKQKKKVMKKMNHDEEGEEIKKQLIHSSHQPLSPEEINNIEVVISPIRRDIRIPVSKIESKNTKQFIAYINCWHFDKFQILRGGEKGPMIRKQMVDLKDVNKLTFGRRRIPVVELLSMLKKENQKKYGYIQEPDFIQWLGENFPERCIVVNDFKYVLLLDDDIAFKLNLFKIIQWINMQSRKSGGFGVVFSDLLGFAKNVLKMKHFKKKQLENYLKQYNNIFKVCTIVSLNQGRIGGSGVGGLGIDNQRLSLNINNNNNHMINNNNNKNSLYRRGGRGGQHRGGGGRPGRGQRGGRGMIVSSHGLSLLSQNHSGPSSGVGGGMMSKGGKHHSHLQYQGKNKNKKNKSPVSPKSNSNKSNRPFFVDNVTRAISGMKRGSVVLNTIPQQEKKVAKIVDPETGEVIDLTSSNDDVLPPTPTSPTFNHPHQPQLRQYNPRQFPHKTMEEEENDSNSNTFGNLDKIFTKQQKRRSWSGFEEERDWMMSSRNRNHKNNNNPLKFNTKDFDPSTSSYNNNNNNNGYENNNRQHFGNKKARRRGGSNSLGRNNHGHHHHYVHHRGGGGGGGRKKRGGMIGGGGENNNIPNNNDRRNMRSPQSPVDKKEGYNYFRKYTT